MEIVIWKNLNAQRKNEVLARAASTQSDDLFQTVNAIVKDIKQNGDAAVRSFTARFDKCDQPIAFVAQDELDRAVANLSDEMRRALDQAIANVSAFHAAQKQPDIKVETMPGVICEMQMRAIDRVGLYVPGGTAPLFSTVLMLALPARIAGCREIVLASPPSADGKINSGILAAAALCGVTRVLPVGGAQAVAALAYGTDTVPKVDKIFGPGNSFVTQAKQIVAQDPQGAAIDMPAGPSEVMVIAVEGENAAWIASDLLAQAEHGRDSQALCVVTDAKLAEAVNAEVVRQAALLPRETLVADALTHSRIICVDTADEALEIANLYAPEHLILHGARAPAWVAQVRNAGAVFVGSYAPETAGDYASGGNHVLPTYGAAKAYSGLTLQSFMRAMTVQSLTKEGFDLLAPSLVALAEAEGLQGHANAVLIRRGRC